MDNRHMIIDEVWRILFFIVMIILGKGTKKRKDFFYIQIPVPLRRLFYIKKYEVYSNSRVPLQLLYIQIILLYYTTYYVITGLGFDLSDVHFVIIYFALALLVLYACICEVFLSRKK